MTNTVTLKEVAAGCWKGACNPVGLMRSLAIALTEKPLSFPLRGEEVTDLRVIVDHLSGIIPRIPPGEVDLLARYDQ